MCAAMLGHRHGLVEDRRDVISGRAGNWPRATVGAVSKMRRPLSGGIDVHLVGRLASLGRQHNMNVFSDPPNKLRIDRCWVFVSMN